MSDTWFKETAKDVEEFQITQDDIEECLLLKKKLKNAQPVSYTHLDVYKRQHSIKHVVT